MVGAVKVRLSAWVSHRGLSSHHLGMSIYLCVAWLYALSSIKAYVHNKQLSCSFKNPLGKTNSFLCREVQADASYFRTQASSSKRGWTRLSIRTIFTKPITAEVIVLLSGNQNMSVYMTALCKATAQPQTNLPQMPRKPGVNACRMHVQSPSYEGLERLSQIPALLWILVFVSDIIVPQTSPHELLYNRHLLYFICYLHKVIEKKSLSSLLRHVWSTPKAIDCALLLGHILSLDFWTAMVDNSNKKKLYLAC